MLDGQVWDRGKSKLNEQIPDLRTSLIPWIQNQLSGHQVLLQGRDLSLDQSEISRDLIRLNPLNFAGPRVLGGPGDTLSFGEMSGDEIKGQLLGWTDLDAVVKDNRPCNCCKAFTERRWWNVATLKRRYRRRRRNVGRVFVVAASVDFCDVWKF